MPVTYLTLSTGRLGAIPYLPRSAVSVKVDQELAQKGGREREKNETGCALLMNRHCSFPSHVIIARP